MLMTSREEAMNTYDLPGSWQDSSKNDDVEKPPFCIERKRGRRGKPDRYFLFIGDSESTLNCECHSQEEAERLCETLWNKPMELRTDCGLLWFVNPPLKETWGRSDEEQAATRQKWDEVYAKELKW